MRDIAIKINNLSKIYRLYADPFDRLKESLHPFRKKYHRDFYALNDVNFEIEKGETVGIIGKNGCGKSTLLQIITGILFPTTGTVMVNGKIAALLELGAGFNPDLTGIENVYFSGTLMGFTREEMDEKIDHILSFADIGEFVYQPVKTYSSGMFVRLAFAVNIASDPEVMIVDEALSVGDMNFQAKCMTALTRIQKSGATVLFVSHDVEAVKSLCNRGVYLENGMVKAIGKAPDVAELYMRTMREEMNEEQQKLTHASTSFKPSESLLKNKQSVIIDEAVFKRSEEFDKRVKTFRYGSGGARITYAELLDEHNQPIMNVEFDQQVSVVICFETEIEEEISCNYYVADEKKNLVIGSGMRLCGQRFIKTKKNGKYTVIYKTRIPLREGNYSIQLQLTHPVIEDQTAEFIDVIDDAIVFKVSRRPHGRIWAHVYVPNSIRVTET
jgi:lipopolysaccharide transport system ATP-binding protein